jgi:small GTP-binding protein
MNSTKKIVLVGHFGVGKSSLIKRFVEQVFSDQYIVTIGVHILKKTIEINQETLTMVIWDIEGKDDLKKLRPSYLIGTAGFIYVIDPTRPQTFAHFDEECLFLKEGFPQSKLVTVANKIDLVDSEEWQQQINMQQHKIDFFTSAKTGQNVEEVFLELGKRMLS